MSRLSTPFALLTLFAAFPPPARARAEAGTLVQNVSLRTVSGGTEKLLSTRVKANVVVFVRTNQERSLDALKQMAVCEKELAGKAVNWVAIVSSTEVNADVTAMVSASGIRMPVLLDENDAVYEALGVRMHPMVAIIDAKCRVVTIEAYRQVDYCDIIKTNIKVLLGEATQAQLDASMNPKATELPGSDPMKKAMRDVNMARKLLEIGELGEATKFAQRGLAIAPVSDGFSVLGEAYARQGKCSDAQRAFDQALKMNPGDKLAMAGKGNCPRR
jgi:tetratricopeptide (TPR) repeat protein